MDHFGNQLYIEGENNDLFIYFHLQDFKIRRASEILEMYIETFKGRDFEKINISFYNKGLPGEHLSTFRKTNNHAIAKLLKGIKCISAFFLYKENVKVINKPRFITTIN
jgi:hypothetical protein